MKLLSCLDVVWHSPKEALLGELWLHWLPLRTQGFNDGLLYLNQIRFLWPEEKFEA